jgi:hypothetical protein
MSVPVLLTTKVADTPAGQEPKICIETRDQDPRPKILGFHEPGLAIHPYIPNKEGVKHAYMEMSQ